MLIRELAPDDRVELVVVVPEHVQDERVLRGREEPDEEVVHPVARRPERAEVGRAVRLDARTFAC
jgi:hypothetical protein